MSRPPVQLPHRVDEDGNEKPLDAPYDAANTSDVKSKARVLRSADRERETVLLAVMEQKEGRAFMHHLIYGMCGLEGSALNVQEVAFSHHREGQRSIGIIMRAQLVKVSKALFVKMIDENTEG